MSATKIVEFVENHGLTNEESISEFFSKTRGHSRELEKISLEFRDALDESAGHSMEVTGGEFNYLASASFRAELGCAVPSCRARRMSEFARFSLLYAERVIFPIYAPKSLDPNWLEGNLRVLAEIRPLMDLGIVVPTESAPCICKRCFEGYAPVFDQVRSAAWDAAPQFRVKYLGAKHGIKRYRKNEWGFHLTWPTDFDSDIPPLLFVKELPPVLDRFVRKKGSEGAEIPAEVIQESGLLMTYFQHASRDYMLQRLYRRNGGCAYLSDSNREVRLLEQLLGQNPQTIQNAALAGMSHDVPLFSNIRLETLVDLRQQDGDAFASYRAALNRAVKDASEQGITLDRSREIYSDILYPQLVALERKCSVLRDRIGKDLLLEFGVPIAALAVGAFTGGSHPWAGNLLQAAGGVELIRSVGKHLKPLYDSSASLDSVKSDPLYFLLRMKREHGNTCTKESAYL